jgi:hypothetical protein
MLRRKEASFGADSVPMDATTCTLQDEETMDRIIERRVADYPALAPPADSGTVASLPPAQPLPPTRAARPARSRGAFFQGRRGSRPARWIFSALCIAVATISIVASAHFAEPAFDSAAITGNSGPALFASTMQAPSFVVARRR